MQTKTRKETKTYQAMTDNDLDRLSPGKCFGEATVTYPNPESGRGNVTSKLMIYDGIAYGTAKVKGKEREVVAIYPLMKFINDTAKSMKEKIKEALGITEVRDVTPAEIMQAYGTFKFI